MDLLLDLDRPPRVPLWRLALARKPGLVPGQRLGPLAVQQRGLVLGDPPAYRALCGLAPDGPLPLAWPFHAAAPLQKALLAHRAFPVPALGLVHVAQQLWARGPLDPAAPHRLRVTAGPWRPARRGIHLDLDTALHDATGALVWWGRTTAWSPAGPGHGRPNPRPPLPAPAPATTATVAVPEDMGRRFGTVAGDRNPIHVHAWLARPFGFRRAIVHGMWTLARGLAALGALLPPGAVHVQAHFLRPVPLPSSGRLVFGPVPGGAALLWHHDDRPCLAATVRSGVAQPPGDPPSGAPPSADPPASASDTAGTGTSSSAQRPTGASPSMP